MPNSEQGPSTIDDVIPNPENADYVSIIECTSCGGRGHMYGSHEPQYQSYYWQCEECSPDEYVEHEIVLTTNAGQQPER